MNDGVSRDDALSPTATLLALAAAGRNPTDITIPIAAGSEGDDEGGDDAVVAGGTITSTSGGAAPTSTDAGSTTSTVSGSSATTTVSTAAIPSTVAPGALHPADDGGGTGASGSHLGPLTDDEAAALKYLGYDSHQVDMAVAQEIPVDVAIGFLMGNQNSGAQNAPLTLKDPLAEFPGVTQAADFLGALAKYLSMSGKQAVGGDFSDEQTNLGTAAQILTNFTPLDTAADIRDLTAAANEVQKNPNDAAARRKLIILAIATLIPFASGAVVSKIIGKSSGDGAEGLGDAAKRLEKNGDETAEAVGGGIAPNNFKWGNPKSKPTYGHTFLEHGKGVKPAQLADRARAKGTQIGQYLDDQAAADLVGDVAQGMGPGVHDVPLPEGLPTRVILPDGTEATADMVRVIVKPDGSVRTSYPFSSAHPRGGTTR